MSENAEKKPEKAIENCGKSSWRGIIRLQVVDILMSRDGYTITEIQTALQQRGCGVGRRVLYTLITEMKGTFKNLKLNEIKVRRYRNKDVPAFYITRNKNK